MNNKRPLVIAGTAAAMATGMVCADMVMVIDDLDIAGLEVIIIDNAPAGTVSASGLVSTISDPDATLGVIGFTDAVPGSVFDVNTTVGISKPVIGSMAFGKIDLSSINVSSSGAGSLSISITDTDFFNNGTFDYTADIGGTTDGSVDFLASAGNLNNEFGATDSVADIALGPGAFSSSLIGTDTFAGDYSLSMTVDIHHTVAGDVTDFDGVIEVIPGPGGLAVAGLALVGLGRRRRRRV